jgi:methionine-rich copper-binding protein CopC
MNRTLGFAALAALALASPSGALAHALLVKAVPAVGGTVATSPTELKLSFSEGVEPRFSGVTLQAADGHAVGTGTANVDPADKATLIVAIKSALPPGSYKVSWHVVSVDTHKTQGSFSFEVKP